MAGRRASGARLRGFASVATHGTCRADGTRGLSRWAVVASIAHYWHSVERGAFEPGRASVAMELSRQAVSSRDGASGFALLVGAFETCWTVDALAHAVCRVLAIGAGSRMIGPIAGGASWAAGAGHGAGVEGVVPGLASLRRLVFVRTGFACRARIATRLAELGSVSAIGASEGTVGRVRAVGAGWADRTGGRALGRVAAAITVGDRGTIRALLASWALDRLRIVAGAVAFLALGASCLRPIASAVSTG